MKPMIFSIFFASIALGNPLWAQSNDDFKGLVDNFPDSRVGDWTIGGRIVPITTKTHFDERNGQVVVGTCVSVDYEGALVQEIATELVSKCLPE